MMAKDPAVLFYTSDFLASTITMSDEQVGKYIKLLCLQHQKGLLSEKDMLNICKTYDEEVFLKFKKNGKGMFYNQRMAEEIKKRKEYSESRRQNRLKNISKSYDKHMGNGNVNIDEIRDMKSLMKYARLKFGEYKVAFDEKKWKFYIPAMPTNIKERNEHLKKWKPIIFELNSILDKL